MAGFLLRFRITPSDGEQPAVVLVGEMDLLRAERRYGAPILGRAQEGYFEPLVQLAYAGAQRAGIIPGVASLDDFIDGHTIELLEDDDPDGLSEDDTGKAPAA